mmetsp:Transcript_30402/g.77592  ORF Transcript_30402/g.77592 Transcript_30402/m.77592 type:complete len:322 (+) Transcript_30402:232-1197(+)
MAPSRNTPAASSGCGLRLLLWLRLLGCLCGGQPVPSIGRPCSSTLPRPPLHHRLPRPLVPHHPLINGPAAAALRRLALLLLLGLRRLLRPGVSWLLLWPHRLLWLRGCRGLLRAHPVRSRCCAVLGCGWLLRPGHGTRVLRLLRAVPWVSRHPPLLRLRAVGLWLLLHGWLLGVAAILRLLGLGTVPWLRIPAIRGLLGLLHAGAGQRCGPLRPPARRACLPLLAADVLVVVEARLLLPPPDVHLPLLIRVAGGQVACHSAVLPEPVRQRARHARATARHGPEQGGDGGKQALALPALAVLGLVGHDEAAGPDVEHVAHGQ